MSRRSIHLLGSPVLRQRAAEVGTPDADVWALVDDLLETMKAYQGIGLAANQVGVARRAAVVQIAEEEPVVLIDPVIVEREGAEIAEEGCLSIPDIYGDVERNGRVVVETTDREGKRVRVEATALKARAIQHEMDHLDGILFLDRVGPLKRWMLVKKWERSRRGSPGLLREPPEADHGE